MKEKEEKNSIKPYETIYVCCIKVFFHRLFLIEVMVRIQEKKKMFFDDDTF